MGFINKDIYKTFFASSENKLNTVIYARKSSEDKSQTSLESQIEECKEFINECPSLNLTDVFSEDNVSGMFTARRLEFNKMIKKVENDEIQIIVVSRADRFSRSVMDNLNYAELLKKHNCMLIAGDVMPDNTTNGEFMNIIRLAMHQSTARHAADATMRTLAQIATDGRTAGGVPPYGLKVVNKKFEIDESEVEAVRILFNIIDKGGSYKDVLNAFETKGYRTRAGQVFAYSTLKVMLQNEKYCGTYVYNKIGGKKKKERVLIAHYPEVRNETAIPVPIISKKQFNRVQTKLKQRSTFLPKQNQSPQYILSGLIKCRNCGKAMSGGKAKSGEKKILRRFYECPDHRARKGSTCDTKNFNALYVENCVKTLITKIVNDCLNTGILTEELAKIQLQKLQDESQKLDLRITKITKMNVRLKNRIQKCNTDILIEEYEKDLAANLLELDRLTKHKIEINKKISAQLEQNIPTVSHFTEEELFKHTKESRFLVNLFIEEIRVGNETLEIIFKNIF